MLLRTAVGQACSTHSPRAICSLAQLALWQPPAQYHHAVALTRRVAQPGSQEAMCYETYLSWNQGTGRALWILTQVMANNFRHVVILPEQILWTAKNMQLWFPFWWRNLGTDFKIAKKSSIFQFICDFIFSQHKYITCEISNWMYRVAIKNLTMSFYQI